MNLYCKKCQSRLVPLNTETGTKTYLVLCKRTNCETVYQVVLKELDTERDDD